VWNESPDSLALSELVAGLIQVAVRSRASDLLIGPGSTRTSVRVRVDGVVQPLADFSPTLHRAVVDALKAASSMDVTGHGVPQHGVLCVRAEKRELRVRVSCVPGVLGDHAALRLPDPHGFMGLHRLGLFPDAMAAMDRIVARRSGLFIVAGSAGSGKTTTLYAMLNRLNEDAKHLMTVEDPVEGTILRATQVTVSPAGGFTALAAIRGCMRQDPDVLMVSEVQPAEVVELASHASGTLVLTALVAHAATAVPSRLVEMGASRQLVASSFAGAVAQRLVRRLCFTCAEPSTPSADVLERLPSLSDDPYLAFEYATFFAPVGCQECRQTGYRGRLGLFQVLEGTPAVRDAIRCGEPPEEIAAIARSEGMRSLITDGLRKAAAGTTSLDEVFRALAVQGVDNSRDGLPSYPRAL
jgi:type II secretory ATPase GspE/PulE/Tfp pilus assembly ATPase PilB-like protein